MLLSLLRIEHGELLVFGGNRGACARQSIVGFLRIRLRGLEALFGRDVAGQQRDVALEVELSAIDLDLGRLQRRLRLVDHRVLQLTPARYRGERRFLGGDRRLGLVDAGNKIGVVDDK